MPRQPRPGHATAPIRCENCGADAHMPVVTLTVAWNVLLDDTVVLWACPLCSVSQELRVPDRIGSLLLEHGAALAFMEAGL